MSKPTIYLFILFIFFSIGICAQDATVNKVVFSVQGNEPIENVNVLTSGNATYTDAKGEFELPFNLYLEFSHVGHENITYNSIDEIPDTIWMSRTNVSLDGVTINSKRTISKIEKLSGFEIKDFEIIGNHIIVFKKSYNGSKSKLSLYNLDGILLSDLDSDPESDFKNLVTNCIGQSYLMDKTHCYSIHVSNGELVLGDKSSRKKFEKLFEKCVLYNKGEWIYEYEKSNGLERNIVSIQEGKDVLLKKIALDEKIDMKRTYQWEIDFGAAKGNILTNDDPLIKEMFNEDIRNFQEESDFLDKVVLTAHESNSFAVMNDGVLIANALLDSLHFIGDQVADKSLKVNKQDFIFNNVEKNKAYLFQKDGRNKYSLNEIDDGMDIQKIHSIKGEKIFKLRIYRNMVFYLMKESSSRSVKVDLYMEKIG